MRTILSYSRKGIIFNHSNVDILIGFSPEDAPIYNKNTICFLCVAVDMAEKMENITVEKIFRLNGEWAKSGGGEDREVDIKGTPNAAILTQQRLYIGRHVFTVDWITFDEDGDYTERTLFSGLETTARKARLAAERALRRYLSRTLEAA